MTDTIEPIGQLDHVRIKMLENAYGLEQPRYAHESDAGFDFRAAIDQPITIYPGKVEIVPTGLSFQMPNGLELQVRPRSGLAAKNGVTVLNAPGTVDAGYRGEVKVILINHGDRPFVIERGDRIAQGVFGLAMRPPIRFALSLAESDRGEGGFGSTGKA